MSIRKTHVSWFLLIAFAVLAVNLQGCATARKASPEIEEPSSEFTKTRLVVALFDNKSDKGNQAMAEGLTDMITSAAFATKRFVLLDRDSLPELTFEQDLLTKQAKMAGAQLILTGSITAFEPKHLSWGGLALGIITFGGSIAARTVWEDFPIFGLSYLETLIQIDLKLIDATSGQVVAQTAIEAESKSLYGGGFVYVRNVNLPVILGGWSGTPTEKTLRSAANQSAVFLSAETPLNMPDASQAEFVRLLSIKKLNGPAVNFKNNEDTFEYFRTNKEYQEFLKRNVLEKKEAAGLPEIDFAKYDLAVISAGFESVGCLMELAKVVDKKEHLKAVVQKVCQEQPLRIDKYKNQTIPPAIYYQVEKTEKRMEVEWLNITK